MASALSVSGDTPGETFSAHFDDVVMTIGLSVIFADGFEDSTTDA